MITAPDEKLHIGDTNHYMSTWAFSYFVILTDLFISWHNYIFHYGLRWDPLITSSAAVLPQPLSREDGGPSHSGSVPPKPVFDRDGKWSLHRTSQWALEQRGDQLQYPAPLGEKLLAAFPSPLSATLVPAYGAGFCLIPLVEALTLCLVPVCMFRDKKGRSDEKWQRRQWYFAHVLNQSEKNDAICCLYNHNRKYIVFSMYRHCSKNF